MGEAAPTNTHEKVARDLKKIDTLDGMTVNEALKMIKDEPLLETDAHTLNFLANDGTVVAGGEVRKMDIGTFLSMRLGILLADRGRRAQDAALDHNEIAARAARDSGVMVVNDGERVVVQGNFDFDATAK